MILIQTTVKSECYYFTAATLPKPTDVNEVIAKKSAVKYFDFASGPLNVSFVTTFNQSKKK